MTSDRCFCVRLEYFYTNGELQDPHWGWLWPNKFVYPDNEQPKERLTITEACELLDWFNKNTDIQIVQAHFMTY